MTRACGSRAAFLRDRYAKLWILSRVRACYEPLGILFMALWLGYSSWDTARHHLAAAAVLGAILGANFLLALSMMGMGLLVGGQWREMPGLSWSLVQKLEMVRAIHQTPLRAYLVVFRLPLMAGAHLLPSASPAAAERFCAHFHRPARGPTERRH